jgi:hypothetical protein
MPERALPMFVCKTMYEPLYVVHPNGGGASRIRCTECGADYPATAKMVPCSNCAVMKQSGIEIRLGSWHRDWLWSDHGWAVKLGGGSWLIDPQALNGSAQRFRHRNDALDAAKSLEEDSWVFNRDYRIEVVPYLVEATA